MDAQRWDDTEVWIRKLVTLQLKRSPWAVLMLEQLCSGRSGLYMGNTYFSGQGALVVNWTHSQWLIRIVTWVLSTFPMVQCTTVWLLLYCMLGCHCGVFLPIGRRHLRSYNHKLSSSPSATNTPLTLYHCCTVWAFCERDMAPRVSNLMAPWNHRKRSVFVSTVSNLMAAPKDKIAAARNKWILGANYSIRAVRPNSGKQRL